MQEIRQSGSEGGARFNPLSLPLSAGRAMGIGGLACFQPDQPHLCLDDFRRPSGGFGHERWHGHRGTKTKLQSDSPKPPEHMKQQISICASILAASLLTAPIQASPTLIISDGVTSVMFSNSNGIVSYATPSFDGAWSIIISTAESKPYLGNAASPKYDMNIQASSLGSSPTRNLVVTFSDSDFSATSGGLGTQLSGHVVTGVGANVTYNTYYDGANGQPTIVSNNTVLPGTAVALTTTGSLPPPYYLFATNTCGAANQALYSLIEQVTIVGSPGGSYSLDASLGVNTNLHCGSGQSALSNVRASQRAGTNLVDVW